MNTSSNPNAKDPMDWLVEALKSNDSGQVGLVLDRHPDLKARLNNPLSSDCFGATPLLFAIQRTNREMIDVLLRAGADINARSHWWAGGFGVLDNDHGLGSFLIERGAIVDVHAAARLDQLERLQELISAQPGLVHARGGDGQTPLHFASTIRAAEYLVNHGADIDALDIDHESTPAQYMVRDRQEVARYLVGRGCRTDILLAAALGDLGLVRRHLDANPDCIRINVSEQYFPKRNPHAGGTIYIWTLGAHKTAHRVAREFRHEDVLELLLERSSPAMKLVEAGEGADEAAFKALLSADPNLIQTLSDPERQKVAFAAQENNTAAVRLMVDAGWPPNVRGQHGATPLHWAAFHGNAEMAAVILRANPPLEWVDADFKGTPLGWAIHGSEHGWHARTGDYAGTVEALLRAGAKPPEKTGGTPAVQEILRRFLPAK